MQTNFQNNFSEYTFDYVLTNICSRDIIQSIQKNKCLSFIGKRGYDYEWYDGSYKKEQVRIIAGLFSPAGVIAAVRRLDIRIIHAILAAVLLIAVTGIGGRMIIANASVKEGQNALERYYTSITIEDCDTLWDIEARYNTGAENKEQYIRSIMQMNHMSSDILYSGQNLIIYYYGQPQTN